MLAWVYMLQCADDRYYVGSYRGDDVDIRVSEHNAGVYPTAWTYHRRPVELVWADWFSQITDAIAFERQLKGWSRAKKEAFLRGEWDRLSELAKRRGKLVKRPAAMSTPSSFETRPSGAPQDEGLPGPDNLSEPEDV